MSSSFRAAGLAVVAGAAVVAAGCGGGGGSPGVASLGSQTTTGAAGGSSPPAGPAGLGSGELKQVDGLQFARCMRSHGVAGFPDPGAGGGIAIGSGSGIDPGSSQFQAAQRACQKYMPAGRAPSPAQLAKIRATFLRYSACMRTHGVANFPDPDISTSGGGIAVKIQARAGGLDPSSSAFQHAQQACRPYLPGGGKNFKTTGTRSAG